MNYQGHNFEDEYGDQLPHPSTFDTAEYTLSNAPFPTPLSADSSSYNPNDQLPSNDVGHFGSFPMPAFPIHDYLIGERSNPNPALEQNVGTFDPFEYGKVTKRRDSAPPSTSSKPKLSLASLIGQAILAQPSQMARLSEIYQWISSHEEYGKYYKMGKGGWTNSVRHNLTVNRAFCRVTGQTQSGLLSPVDSIESPTSPTTLTISNANGDQSSATSVTVNGAMVPITTSSKGSYWMIEPSHRHLFQNGIFIGKIRSSEYRKACKIRNKGQF